MRWFLWLGIAACLACGAFFASPYLALYDLVRAVERGDVARVDARVNFRARRASLTKELLAGYFAEVDPSGKMAASERQLAASTLASAAEPLLATLLTPEGLIDLLRRTPQPARQPGDAPGARFAIGSGFGDLFALVARAQTRGFRTIYFALPPQAPAGTRFRLQFRLSRFHWRLVGLELPLELTRELRRRIGERLADADRPGRAP
jgi:hypothetical protein